MATGVVFDVDGTLVDTTFIHTVCWADALAMAGHQVTMASVHHAIGMGSRELLDYLVPDRDTTDDEQIKAARLALYRQYWGRLAAFPGAADLLRACADGGHQVVLASSASSDELAALKQALAADDVIDVATSSSDAERGKPEPDILTAALEQSGVDAAAAVFVGDSVWDAEAAAKAGITFVGVACGGTPAAELRNAGAVETWRDPADLLAHLRESVLSR
ncbi:MAG TPA: HAD family hydrolase [Jatrophihabitans sp.]|jgi:HAD superfamily hydrolase (TIGR01509 family)